MIFRWKNAAIVTTRYFSKAFQLKNIESGSKGTFILPWGGRRVPLFFCFLLQNHLPQHSHWAFAAHDEFVRRHWSSRFCFFDAAPAALHSTALQWIATLCITLFLWGVGLANVSECIWIMRAYPWLCICAKVPVRTYILTYIICYSLTVDRFVRSFVHLIGCSLICSCERKLAGWFWLWLTCLFSTLSLTITTKTTVATFAYQSIRVNANEYEEKKKKKIQQKVTCSVTKR